MLSSLRVPCGALLVCASLLLLALSPSRCSAFNVYVSAKDQACFSERVLKGEKVVGSYWVNDGGALDIDLRMLGPDNKVVYERERSSDGSFQFKAIAEGLHTLCLDNRMSTVSGKNVHFELYVGDALHRRDAAGPEALSPLETAVTQTADGMRAIRESVAYAKKREQRHADTINSTNGRVAFCAAINTLVLLAVAAAQILVIRGMFEKTRRA